jgi:uncharacterized protein (TIGR00375 family)
MKFIADLHIHSKYSIATAKNLDLEHIYIAARLKGITLVGTGDFTHPAWFEEIGRKLVAAEPGLYRLDEKISAACESEIPAKCRGEVRFVLTAEISNIYKKAGCTRKNHNLILMAEQGDAQRLNQRLARVGNIHSDGRPTLGLDARDLLEMVLEIDDRVIFIPAHVWTPWFSLLGSKSGFDSVEECFEDLTPHIFALETGLSSDPAMNWRVSNLDRYTLVSNSDAHSPMKLGREANRFNTELSFAGVYNALKNGNHDQFEGTFEFFPQEGKYHLDGHNKCGVCLTPSETRRHDGLCPHCGKPLTLGVLNRVESLADQPQAARKGARHPYISIIPLMELLAEIYGMGVNTKTVGRAYHKAINRLGDEFSILSRLSRERLAAGGIPLLAEAVERMRAGTVKIDAGYDGRFGKVRLFDAAERRRLEGQQHLFRAVSPVPNGCKKHTPKKQDGLFDPPFFPIPPDKPNVGTTESVSVKKEYPLNNQQAAVVTHDDTAMIVVAGPGTGKTHTITARMARLIDRADVEPDHILALTFTNKAAGEMRRRVAAMTGMRSKHPLIATFHGFCSQTLAVENHDSRWALIDTETRRALIRDVIDVCLAPAVRQAAHWTAQADMAIMRAKQRLAEKVQAPDLSGLDHIGFEQANRIHELYNGFLQHHDLLDFEDLIIRVVRRLKDDPHYRHHLQRRFRYIFVDEYQDLNEGQYRLLRLLVPADGYGLCAIGDPDQAIYGFRGSDQRFFLRFKHDYPEADVISLQRNYRSTPAILMAARQTLSSVEPHRIVPGAELLSSTKEQRTLYSDIQGRKTIGILTSNSDREEARAIARLIEEHVGGRGFHDFDTGWVERSNAASRTYGDFAVLYRTHFQAQLLAQALGGSGIPFTVAAREALFQQAGIADLLALIKLLHGRGVYSDLGAAAALMKAPPSKQALTRLKRWGMMRKIPAWRALSEAQHLPISDLSRNQQMSVVRFARWVQKIKGGTASGSAAAQLKQLAQETGREYAMDGDPQLARCWELIIDLAENRTMDDFLNRISLYQDSDRYSATAQQVTLMSMHAAKGLEFAVVIVAGCENGLIPYRGREAELSNQDLAEEARLFYVAMTRAQSELYLSWSKQRHRYGRCEACRRSPFVDAIEQCLLVRENFHRPRKKRHHRQLQLF